MARFSNTNEHSDWESAHHVFTYTNAIHQIFKRIENAGINSDVMSVRCVLHGAMALYLAPISMCRRPAFRVRPTNHSTIYLPTLKRSASPCSMRLTGSNRLILRQD